MFKEIFNAQSKFRQLLLIIGVIMTTDAFINDNDTLKWIDDTKDTHYFDEHHEKLIGRYSDEAKYK